MKKYINMLFAMALAGLMAMNVSCSNEEADNTLPEEKNEMTTIYATISDTQTRLDYGDYNSSTGIRITWKEGDEFALYTEIGSSKVATFTCKSVSDGVGAFTYDETFNNGSYYAVYCPGKTPNSLGAVESSKIMTGQKQKGDNNKDHLSDYNVMLSETFTWESDSNGSVIKFNHYTSILRIEIELPDAITPSLLTLKTDGEGFVLGKYAFESDPTAHSKEITLGLENITDTTQFTAYMAVYQGSVVEDFLEFTVKTDEGTTYSEKISFPGKSQPYTAGKIYSSTVTLKKETASTQWAVGDYWPDKDNASTAKGVVFWVAEDNNSFKVVALNDEPSSAFSVLDAFFTIPADPYGKDGDEYTEWAKGFGPTLDNFPAFKACAAIDDTWYLPSVLECIELSINYDNISSKLSAVSEGESIESGFYWSSNADSSDPATAVAFDIAFGNLSEGESVKSLHPIRCVKKEPRQ